MLYIPAATAFVPEQPSNHGAGALTHTYVHIQNYNSTADTASLTSELQTIKEG